MVDPEEIGGESKEQSMEFPFIVEADDKLEELYKDQRKKQIHGFLKDIEIGKEKYLLLSLIFNSIGCILSLMLDLSLVRLQSNQSGIMKPDLLGLIMGGIIGIIFSLIKIDYEERRLTLIQLVLIGASINMAIQIIFSGILPYFFVFISYGLNTFAVTVLFLTFLTLLLDFSSILERGRVFAFLILEFIVSVAIISTISQVGLHNNHDFLLLVTLVFPILTILFISKDKVNLEKPRSKIIAHEDRHVNRTILTYLSFILVFSFTIGLATPGVEMEQFLLQVSSYREAEIDLIFILGLIFLFSAIIAVDIGFFFDYFGRKLTISNILLTLAIANFLNVITFSEMYIQEIIFGSLYVGLMMGIVLLIGDVTKRKNYGKVLSIGLIICIVGVILGQLLKDHLRIVFSNNDTGLISFLYLSSAVCFVFLVGIKETLPHKEKEWFESLFELYIIHKSGISIYSHQFKRDDDRMESELISGGIIGITSLLKEIVQGKEGLKTIDHGDKKLMFNYSPEGDVVFVLLIGEDLFILRNKLNNFSEEFIEVYSEELSNFEFCDSKQWENVPELIDKYFERKYFDFSPPHRK